MIPGAETVLGRYRLGERIGAGGMGTVFRAHDGILGREVAVKLLREELAADERSLARFRQEARIAASLSHPGIAAVYDFAEYEAPLKAPGEGWHGRPAIVMELLDGHDLHTILEREGPMEPERVAGILAQAADALAYAHERGAVHRDVKPANIFLTSSGSVKVTDFGVAYAAGGAPGAGQLTQTGALIGTPDYLSPEQVRGQRATAASDIYSLGCVAFQLVTGRPPFGGDSSVAAAAARLDAPAPSARAHNPQVGPDLDTIIRRALAPVPTDRFPSAASMARALRSAASVTGHTPPMGLGGQTRQPGAGTVPLMVSPPTIVEAPPGTPPGGLPAGGGAPPPPAPRRRHRLMWLWVGLLVLFVAGLGLDIVRSWQRLNAPKTVPMWTNASYDSAAAAARGMGFVVRRSDIDSMQPLGQVLKQDPPAGVKLKRGLTVTLEVSRGNQVVVPDVSSRTVADATNILQGQGLTVDVSTQTVPGSVDGQVAAQNPPANAVVYKGAKVTLTQTAVPPQDQTAPTPDQTPSDTPSQSQSPGLMCSLLGIGCPAGATPTPTPTKRRGSTG